MTAVILRRRGLGKATADGVCAASAKGIYTIRNWVEEDGPDHSDDAPDYIFRWGCTSNITFAQGDAKIVNTAKAIHWCSDKRNSRLEMQAAGVPVPETWSAENFRGEVDTILAETHHRSLSDRFVMRPAHHAQGRNLLAGTAEELAGSYDEDSTWHGGYVSRLINKVAEYRVFVCHNRAVWVAKKTPGNPDQVAWNVAQGGRFDNVRWGDWPLPVIKAALSAAKVSGTDFCGVDVMVDAEGKPYVLEVNSAPSQTSEYRQRCVAKVFDYIIEHGKQHFDDVPDGRRLTYKSYIHPAVCASERSDPAIRPQE